MVLNGTPVDVSKIPQNLIKSPPTEGKPWRFLYLSNLMTTKGYQDLLAACHLLLEQGLKNFQCDFCGEFLSSVAEGKNDSNEDRKAAFLAQIENSPLKGHVYYHGTVSGDQKTQFLSESHFLLLPTYYPWEGQPLSINEALAWSTPVVTTYHRGIPEQVQEGVNGYFVESQDPQALADCLARFLRNEIPYQVISKQARIHYEGNFTNEQHLATLIQLLH